MRAQYSRNVKKKLERLSIATGFTRRSLLAFIYCYARRAIDMDLIEREISAGDHNLFISLAESEWQKRESINVRRAGTVNGPIPDGRTDGRTGRPIALDSVSDLPLPPSGSSVAKTIEKQFLAQPLFALVD